jgi:hypothetical protein
MPLFSRYLLIYIAANTILSVLLYFGVPRAQRRPAGGVFAFMLFFCLALPVMGPFAMLLGVIVALRSNRMVWADEFQLTAVPLLPLRVPKLRSRARYGQGGFMEVMKNAVDPVRKFAVLFAAAKMKDREAIPVLRAAMKDANDDVRLFAYSALYKREHTITERIAESVAALEKTEGEECFKFYRAAAESYWELYYLGLSAASGERHILQQAGSYAECALEMKPRDGSLHLLHGRILMAAGEAQPAFDEFLEAGRCGMARRSLLPYLAEAAFYCRRFGDVKNYLSELKAEAAGISRMLPVMEYWT